MTQQQQQQNKQPDWKVGRGPEHTFFQRRHTDGQQAHEKMTKLSSTSGYLSKKYESTFKKYMHSCVHCTIIYNSQDMETI